MNYRNYVCHFESTYFSILVDIVLLFIFLVGSVAPKDQQPKEQERTPLGARGRSLSSGVRTNQVHVQNINNNNNNNNNNTFQQQPQQSQQMTHIKTQIIPIQQQIQQNQASYGQIQLQVQNVVLQQQQLLAQGFYYYIIIIIINFIIVTIVISSIYMAMRN
jgi:hypothetical protein